MISPLDQSRTGIARRPGQVILAPFLQARPTHLFVDAIAFALVFFQLFLRMEST